MIRKTLVTAALTAGILAGTAGVASAHECFVANRSDKGNAGAAHSANWFTLELSMLFGEAHNFLGGRALTDAEVDEAVATAAAQGIPTSFTVFEKFTIPRNLGEFDAMTQKSSDGKGIDHFFHTYGGQLAGIYFGIAGAPAQV